MCHLILRDLKYPKVISDLSKGGIHAIKVLPHFERSEIAPKLFQISQKEVFT
jgi:hypothetical protein